MGKCFKNISLSKREAEYLFHLIHGKTAKEIAQNLGVSPRTVESSINNIKLKIGATSKSELAQKLFNIVHVFNQKLI